MARSIGRSLRHRCQTATMPPPVPIHVVGCEFDPDGFADPSCTILVLSKEQLLAMGKLAAYFSLLITVGERYIFEL